MEILIPSCDASLAAWPLAKMTKFHRTPGLIGPLVNTAHRAALAILLAATLVLDGVIHAGAGAASLAVSATHFVLVPIWSGARPVALARDALKHTSRALKSVGIVGIAGPLALVSAYYSASLCHFVGLTVLPKTRVGKLLEIVKHTGVGKMIVLTTAVAVINYAGYCLYPSLLDTYGRLSLLWNLDTARLSAGLPSAKDEARVEELVKGAVSRRFDSELTEKVGGLVRDKVENYLESSVAAQEIYKARYDAAGILKTARAGAAEIESLKSIMQADPKLEAAQAATRSQRFAEESKRYHAELKNSADLLHSRNVWQMSTIGLAVAIVTGVIGHCIANRKNAARGVLPPNQAKAIGTLRSDVDDARRRLDLVEPETRRVAGEVRAHDGKLRAIEPHTREIAALQATTGAQGQSILLLQTASQTHGQDIARLFVNQPAAPPGYVHESVAPPASS